MNRLHDSGDLCGPQPPSAPDGITDLNRVLAGALASEMYRDMFAPKVREMLAALVEAIRRGRELAGIYERIDTLLATAESRPRTTPNPFGPGVDSLANACRTFIAVGFIEAADPIFSGINL